MTIIETEDVISDLFPMLSEDDYPTIFLLRVGGEYCYCKVEYGEKKLTVLDSE